jgi:hypothetical protein
MLEMLFNFFPQWLVLYKAPMSPEARQKWGKVRKVGCPLFVMIVTLCLGGFATVLDFGWDMLAGHQQTGGSDITMRSAWWFSGALIVGLVEWFLNESRFRLPSKPAPSDRHVRPDRV